MIGHESPKKTMKLWECFIHGHGCWLCFEIVSIFAGTEEFRAKSLKLEEPGSCFHVKLGFSVHQNAFYKHMMQQDLMHWFMSEERSHIWPVCVSFIRLPNSQDAHTTPVCSTKTKTKQLKQIARAWSEIWSQEISSPDWQRLLTLTVQRTNSVSKNLARKESGTWI